MEGRKAGEYPPGPRRKRWCYLSWGPKKVKCVQRPSPLRSLGRFVWGMCASLIQRPCSIPLQRTPRNPSRCWYRAYLPLVGGILNLETNR